MIAHESRGEHPRLEYRANDVDSLCRAWYNEDGDDSAYGSANSLRPRHGVIDVAQTAGQSDDAIQTPQGTAFGTLRGE